MAEDTVRDFQRSRVYKWEAMVVHAHGSNQVLFCHAKSFIDHVWQNEGLQYPPILNKLPKNVTSCGARANRTEIDLPESVSTSTILHELAHSMTSWEDGRIHMHNGVFVGMVMQLYSKYLGLDMLMLQHTATQMKVLYETNVRPVFLD